MNIHLKEEALQFLEKVTERLKSSGIKTHNWEIDHLCYRTCTQSNYEESKIFFERLGQCLIESEINGRPIATYKLYEPIFFKDWIIDLIEVPAPKPGKETNEGFEHIEVVIDCSFKDFLNQNSKIEFEKTGLSKELNPELEVEFDNCAVKFHHKSLEHIINIEKDSKVMTFLKKSELFSLFKEYNPCISGTRPLGIHLLNSDLDILLTSEESEEFIDKSYRSFGNLKQYSQRITEHQGLKSVVINFEFEGLPIELFCQNKSVYRQQANQHFLIEGRLLKIFGNPLKQQILDLKEKGMKTEPAFEKLLNLPEPYKSLIELQKCSDRELRQKFESIFIVD
jgi:predicted metalloenzyme YecM